ncbi:nucleic-acid-binding protein from transposon X-element [Trichonephila clavipes]|nr:nucleic-acid-binding protein from transposon X-element [Trichonephila clavipes]
MFRSSGEGGGEGVPISDRVVERISGRVKRSSSSQLKTGSLLRAVFSYRVPKAGVESIRTRGLSRRKKVSDVEPEIEDDEKVPAQNQLPAPIMLFIDEELSYKAQMAAITKEFPKIRSRLTGEYLKLYTDTAEERRSAVQLLKKLKYQFYTFKSKAERPIKVVIKGIPRKTDPEEIKQDLELLGYTPDRVNQLIGRKTKRTLPIFLITLPRNLDNLKIFDLKTLGYLSVRVEGYDGRGVTQCYTCNKFNHTSENCHLNPRCLKCGENHITRDCPLKQKLETAYCINCNIYGHMANYRGCPSFPKPPKEPPKTIGTPTQIFTIACSSPIGLSLCSWNANGLLRKYAELRIFIEKHSPDILLIQETHLRPSHNFNIANYTCHRNDRISEGARTAGGTLILVKNSIKHYCLPTPTSSSRSN